VKQVLYLAPLHGVTNHIFRNIYFKYFKWFDYAVAPFVLSVKSIRINKKRLKDLLPENNIGINLIPQILSNDPDEFVVLSKLLIDYNYNEINWNLGCPYPMIANKYRGSGLLPYPDRIKKILDFVFSKLNIAISIKLRLGRLSSEEIFKLIPVLNDYPLSKIIIHPRIGIQMYKGNVDLENFEKSYSQLKHKVVYNGDIKSIDDFNMYKKRFKNINEWMIGRYAISNPFIAGQIKNENVNTDEKIKIIRFFHDELFNKYEEILYGPRHLMDKMKEIWSYLSVSFYNGDMIYRRLSKIKHIEAFKKEINLIFENEKWIA
jgi:tRNA-dihydrouridine synthase